MKKIILALMFVFVCSGLGLAQKGRKATAQEKKDLFQLILKDKSVSESLPDMGISEKELSKFLIVEKKDLNKDGKMEYLATLDNAYMCGAHANCPHWVFRKTGDSYKLLLAAAGQLLTPQKNLSNKFFDLRSDGSSSAVESSYEIYKFDGKEYKATDCFTVDHSQKKPKTTRVQCQE